MSGIHQAVVLSNSWIFLAQGNLLYIYDHVPCNHKSNKTYGTYKVPSMGYYSD